MYIKYNTIFVKKKDNYNKFELLRTEYPYFIFESYSYTTIGNALNIEFVFNLSDKYYFNPKLSFPNREFYNLDKVTDLILQNLVFNLGMIELISYWKAACSHEIIIKPHLLTNKQIDWWKKLYFNGLGEFFYLNSIDVDLDSFVKIKSISKNKLSIFKLDTNDDVIIPIGGGKDSIVTIESMKSTNKTVTPLILNLNEARERTIRTAGFSIENSIVINRTIDPKLIELNKKGFLNGHTPFSAVLAFLSVTAAAISGKRNIALSNESSANEVTVEDTNINHQYSKSYEFEKDFREYLAEFICSDINYFSFLRPLNELQIAKYFYKYPQYFSKFRSCNVGSKSDEWCGNCPKCLFTFIILSPFIERKKLIQMFNKDLFNDEKLIDIFEQLTGNTEVKPFECIGTIDEVNAAIMTVIDSFNQENLPKLFQHYKTYLLKEKQTFPDKEKLLNNFEKEHFLSDEFEVLLRR